MCFRFQRRLAWILLIAVCCALIFSVTILPFQLDLRALSNPDVGEGQIQLVERLLNIVLFVPLGYALTSVGERRRLRAVIVAAVLSAGIEVAQSLIGTRDPDVLDVLANTAGAAVGASLTRWSIPAAGSWFWRALFAFWIGAVTYPIHRVTQTLVLAGWDDSYELTLGDEFGGGREYRGHVDFGTICGGTVDDEECHEIRGPTRIGPEFSDRIESAQRFRLEVKGAPASYEQAGPARLITWSQDYTHRNAMLGQSNQDAIFRVRTRGSSANGTAPSYRFPNAFEGVAPGDSFTSSALWDRGRITLNVRGASWEYSRHILLGPARLLSLRSVPEPYIEPRDSGFRDQIAAAVVAFPTGFGAAGLVASVWLGLASLPLVALAFACAPTLFAGVSAPPMWWTIPSFIAAALLGWMLARATILSRTTAER